MRLARVLSYHLLPIALLAACYNPNIPSGVQTCGNGGACAPGFMCGCDNHCWKPGEEPQCKPPPDLAMEPTDMAMGCTQASCSGATPQCDPDTLQCVPCLKDEHCPVGRLCKGKSCVPGCNMTRGCGDAGVCDPMTSLCKVCKGDNDCAAPAGKCDVASGRCVECVPGAKGHCADGQFCGKDFKCAMGCAIDDDCNAMVAPPDGGADTDAGADGDGGAGDGGVPMVPARKMACCKNVCVDVNTDTANCGGCGTSCGNLACCTGSCTDTKSDLVNCGMCGNACGGKNAKWICDKSACSVTSCNGGFGDCNKDPSDGCEVNINTDPLHCTGCNKPCANPTNATAGCMGKCFLKSCKTGFDNCNGNEADGCETPVAADANNCGKCNNKCVPPLNALSAQCKDNACVVGSCKQNFADCNMNPADGCEVNLLADGLHCTACNKKCPAPQNATGKCSNGVCGVGSCNAGFDDCNNNFGDGCEIETAKDPNHCGKCFQKCAAVANGTPGCANSQCNVASCGMGFADCNKVYGDGCEANLLLDSANCGACGKVCPNNMPHCNNGTCAVLTTFQGVRKDVAIASLSGWTQCFVERYDVGGKTSFATLQQMCNRPNILLGCRLNGSGTLLVAAHAPRGDVFFDTGGGVCNGFNNPRNANGVGWYYNNNYSWGFAKQGDPLNRCSCDTNQTNGDLRLCIHAGGGNLQTGYRCGTNFSSNAIERVVFHAN